MIMNSAWQNLIRPIFLIALLLAAGAAWSQDNYNLDWFTVDGGGLFSSGGDYTLQGTIGQPDAGTLTGGQYTLTGGFWSAADADRSASEDWALYE